VKNAFIATVLLLTFYGAIAAEVVKPTNVDDTNYAAEVKDYKGFVIVDYNAPWCLPCREFAPEFEIIANDMKGEVKAVSIDTDVARVSAAAVKKIPRIVLYKDGVEIGVYDSNKNRNHVNVEAWIRQTIEANSK